MAFKLGKMLLEQVDICQGKIRQSVGLDFFAPLKF